MNNVNSNPDTYFNEPNNVIDRDAVPVHMTLMALFRFFLVGPTAAPIIEVCEANLTELTEALERYRFIAGRTVDLSGAESDCGVVISTYRIQMVSEVIS